MTVKLSVNASGICKYLSDVAHAKACKDMLQLCAAGNKSSSNADILAQKATAASGLFHCDADTIFAKPGPQVLLLPVLMCIGLCCFPKCFTYLCVDPCNACVVRL